MAFIIIIAAVVIAVIIQLILSRRQVGNINAQIFLETDAAEPDEKFHIIIKIDNPSRIIYPFLRFNIYLPDDITVHSQLRTASRPPASIEVIGSCVLLPKKSVERRIEISAPSRGVYRFSKFALTVGDFLGLKEYQKDYSEYACIAIYPTAADNADVPQTLGGVMGDYSVRRFIYEDPVLISGFREYSGNDPMKSISWLQSARTGQLMVKSFDHTCEMSATIVLDTEDVGDNFEACFSLARSVCDFLEENGIEYDFFMNAAIGGISSNTHYLAKGLGDRHYYGILKQLAAAQQVCMFSGLEMAEKVFLEMRNTSEIIYISGKNDEARQAVLAKLRENPMVNVTEIHAGEVQ